jgi:ferric-dicitrate binding protein FerR (iron transport regulator)
MPARNISWARAASILLVVAVGGMLMYFISRNSSPDMITLRSGNATLTDTLPDGSVVILNKDAELSYPEDFDGDTRRIALNGEAFFDVAPDKNKPFVISVNEVTVQVVGTSFNVKGTSERTEVIVETGIVAVKKNTNEVKLAPNEKAVVLKSSAAPVKEDVEDALYNYYRTKEFVCNGTPLWRLADVLGDAYSVNITIATERAKNLELTTTFKNESLENILTIIGETLNVRIERKGVDYIIK